MSEPTPSTIDQVEGTPTPQQGADILAEALAQASPSPEQERIEAVAEHPDEPAVQDQPEPEPAEVEAQGEPEPAPVPPAEPAPYAPQVQADAAQRYAAIAEELKALGAKYDSGEIATDEYHAQTLALHDERTALVVAHALAVEHARANEHQTAAAWSAAQQQFWAQPGNERYADDPELFDAMNGAIQRVGADPAIRAQGFAAILDAAKARVEKSFGVSAPPAAKPTAADIKAQARAKAAGIRSPVPASLSDFPGGAPPATDEFAAVPDQAPADLMETVLAYTPEKLQRFLDRRI